jgi:hypothetical protein
MGNSLQQDPVRGEGVPHDEDDVIVSTCVAHSAQGYYLLLPGRGRAGAPEAPCNGLAATCHQLQWCQLQLTVGVQQCLRVTAAFACVRGGGRVSQCCTC